MGFFKDLTSLTGLTIVQTACKSVSSKIKDWETKRKKEQLEALNKLKELYDAGTITEREYKKMKKEIMKKYKE